MGLTGSRPGRGDEAAVGLLLFQGVSARSGSTELTSSRSDEAAVGLLLLQRRPDEAARLFDMLDRSVRRREQIYFTAQKISFRGESINHVTDKAFPRVNYKL